MLMAHGWSSHTISIIISLHDDRTESIAELATSMGARQIRKVSEKWPKVTQRSE